MPYYLHPVQLGQPDHFPYKPEFTANDCLTPPETFVKINRRQTTHHIAIMPAPTALLQKPVEAAAEAPLPQPDQDEEVLLDASEMNNLDGLDTNAIQLVSVRHNTEPQMDVDEEGKPHFAPARDTGSVARIETRKVPIPPHRMSPLKATWPKIYPVIVEHLALAVRMNVKSKAVELRTTRKTTDTGALQKGADFVTAFALGFDIDDAVALLRLDDLYIETFEIKDVKTLEGDHKGKPRRGRKAAERVTPRDRWTS